jgi:hypothetical protein
LITASQDQKKIIVCNTHHSAPRQARAEFLHHSAAKTAGNVIMRELKRNAIHLFVMAVALGGCQAILPTEDAADSAKQAADEPNSSAYELILTASEPLSTPILTSTAADSDPNNGEPANVSIQDALVSNSNIIDIDSDAYYAMCGGRLIDLEDILQPIAERLMSQQISYSQVDAHEWRDCSGNFLRLSSYVAERCPELNGRLAATKGVRDFVHGDNNTARPATAVARTTRDIARWYAENDSFIPVYYDQDSDEQLTLAKYRDHIKPGTVLWFAREKPNPSAGMAPLFASQINHMGTVISVERDENGELLSYNMYHGRNENKVATVTKDHYWDWPDKFTSGGKQYPPLGYWTQYLVGIAPIAPVSEPIMLSSLER